MQGIIGRHKDAELTTSLFFACRIDEKTEGKFVSRDSGM